MPYATSVGARSRPPGYFEPQPRPAAIAASQSQRRPPLPWTAATQASMVRAPNCMSSPSGATQRVW